MDYQQSLAGKSTWKVCLTAATTMANPLSLFVPVSRPMMMENELLSMSLVVMSHLSSPGVPKMRPSQPEQRLRRLEPNWLLSPPGNACGFDAPPVLHVLPKAPFHCSWWAASNLFGPRAVNPGISRVTQWMFLGPPLNHPCDATAAGATLNPYDNRR